jgi:hypothetical protein
MCVIFVYVLTHLWWAIILVLCVAVTTYQAGLISTFIVCVCVYTHFFFFFWDPIYSQAVIINTHIYEWRVYGRLQSDIQGATRNKHQIVTHYKSEDQSSLAGSHSDTQEQWPITNE